MRKLWLFDNRLGDAGAAALAPILASDQLLEVWLQNVLCNLFNPMFCGNSLGSDIVTFRLERIRAATLESNTAHKAGPGACKWSQVHLSHNMIGAAGAAALVRAVPAPPLRGAAAKGPRRQGPCRPGGPGGLWLRLEWNQIPVGSAVLFKPATTCCYQCM